MLLRKQIVYVAFPRDERLLPRRLTRCIAMPLDRNLAYESLWLRWRFRGRAGNLQDGVAAAFASPVQVTPIA